MCGLSGQSRAVSSIIQRSVSDGRHGGGAGHAAAAVQTIALAAKQHEPVDLWRQDAEAAQGGGRRQVEGHGVQRDAVMLAVNPVHVGEEGDAAREEGEQHHAAVSFVQPAVLKAELQEETRRRRRVRKRTLKLRQKAHFITALRLNPISPLAPTT